MEPLKDPQSLAELVSAEYRQAEEKPLTVKELDEDDRPREKALRYGVGTLSVADLLAILLRTGVTGHPITEICRALMRANDGLLLMLERRTRAELLEIEGIGNAKALQIEALLELIRRYNSEELGERPKIGGPQHIFQLMRPIMGNLPHEEMWAVFMNNSNMVIGKQRLSIGSARATVFDIKALLKHALLINSEAIALCHNHPSGSLRPSPQDTELTKRVYAACKTVELRFLDHLIISADGYYSFQNESNIFN